jgi:hypothetical protein
MELDQIHLPDPVSQELCRLALRIAHLEEALKGKVEIAPTTKKDVEECSSVSMADIEEKADATIEE